MMGREETGRERRQRAEGIDKKWKGKLKKDKNDVMEMDGNEKEDQGIWKGKEGEEVCRTGEEWEGKLIRATEERHVNVNVWNR